jgi:hypothetical protein
MMDVYYLNAILLALPGVELVWRFFLAKKNRLPGPSLVQRRNCRIDDRAGVRQVEKAQTTPWNGSSFTSRRVNAHE